MSHSADDRPEGSDDLPLDNTSTSSNEWRSEPAPDVAADPASYGTDWQPPAPGQNSGPYNSGQYSDQQYGTSPYGGQSHGAQPYGGQPYGGQAYGQPYGGQAYGQPYGGQAYGQPYSAVQPYGQMAQVARKEPGLMLLASFFIPGLGTILNGETGKGVGILIAYFISYLLIFVIIGIPMVIGFWVWGMIDAYNGAKNFNARHGLP